MSTRKGEYNEFNLIENLTTNGDHSRPGTTHMTLQGEHALAFYGAFNGATLSIVFFTETAGGTLEEMPVSADWTFTAAPEVSAFNFPKDMPFVVRVTGAGASTDISINAHAIL